MDMRYLRTFLYVAELGSFTRAAEALSYAQPTVSFQIRQLEKELGVRLFDRVNHTIAVTEDGRQVLQYAHRISQLEQELDQALHAEKAVAGHIRMATADSLCPMLLGERFAAFRRAYPGITLKIIPAGTDEMFRLLGHNEADIVLTLDSHIYHAEYITAQEERIHTHFVASLDHPLCGAGPLCLADLTREPFLLTERGMSYRRMMDEALAAQNLEIDPVLEIGSTEQIVSLVAQGAGLSFLPDYATEKAVAEGRLCRLEVTDLSVDVWKQLIYHRDKWVSPAMQKVLEYCMQA